MSRPTPVFISQGQIDGQPCCPVCQELLDGFTHMASDPDQAARPGPGDISVCAYCSTVSTFALGPRGLVLRLATPEERAGASGPLPLAHLEGVSREFRRRRQH